VTTPAESTESKTEKKVAGATLPDIALDLLKDPVKPAGPNAGEQNAQETVAAQIDGQKNPCTIEGANASDKSRNPQAKQATDTTDGVVDFEEVLKGNRSDGAYVREQLTAKGLDKAPHTTPVRIGEPAWPKEAPTHPQKVEESIKHPEYGISPDTPTVIDQPIEKSRLLKLESFSGPNQLKDFAAAHSAQTVRDFSEYITNSVITETPSRAVVNYSQEHSPDTTANQVVRLANSNPELHRDLLVRTLGEERANQWIADAKMLNDPKAQIPDGHSLTTPAVHDKILHQAVLPQIKDAVAESADFKTAMADYRGATRQAAENGKVIVVAAGNQGDRQDSSIYSYYAQSEHVISVGAYDNNNSPENRADDEIWNLSSPGSARYHPDVVAQGVMVPSSVSPENPSKSGTSYAAPFVSGAIANMLDHNPRLSFNQIKTMVQGTAHPLEDVSKELQGQGRIDAVRLIELASASAKADRS